MAENFTAKQKEIVARKLGYDGPMQGFDDFLNSSPALGMKYATITDKFATRMAKGGLVKNYQVGGVVSDSYDANPSFDPNAAPVPFDARLNVIRTPNSSNMTGSDPFAGLASSLNNMSTSNTSGSVRGELSNQINTTPIAPVVGGTPETNLTPTIASAPVVQAATTTMTPEMLAQARQAGETIQATATPITKTAEVAAPTAVKTTAATTTDTTADIQAAQAKQAAATGVVSPQAQVAAQQGTVSQGALATQQQVGGQFIAPVVAQERVTAAGEMVQPVTEAPVVKAEAAQAAAPTAVQAAQGVVKAEELVKPAQIAEKDMAQATAITAAGLAPDAKVVAARLDKFTVDDGTLAAAAQGNVDAQSTVQGQLTELMKSFDDGATPAWAAGAIRAANAVMASRGLGGSSMAATAVFQAAMESALPIAAQDAQVFQQMGMQNLNNRQQVALANAAAQQGLSLQNLSNEQQARLTNATNSFALQSQNLSNMQQTMLANTQIRASLQGQNLSNQQQAAVVNAARYAEMANINLNNLQQAALHNSSMQVQVDIANASNRQQTALANAQIEAAMQGKVLDNKQQAAVLNAAQIAENLNTTFTAAQNAALSNSQLMKDIGVANLSAAQQTTLANAATLAAMDMTNLNNRQQAAVQNAQAFLATDMKNLDNKQQMAVLQSQQITQSILSDAAAANAASLTNATNAIDVEKVNATLAMTANQFNAGEKNKTSLANMAAANEIARFNAQSANQREEFNANMTTQINVANAKILADVSTANTAAINAASAVNAKNYTDLSAASYAQVSQTYRDLLEMSWKTGESEKERITNIAATTITANASIDAAKFKASAEASASIGGAALKALENDKVWNLLGKGAGFVTGLFTED